MTTDGRGDLDLVKNRGVGHVDMAGTSAQTSHFTTEYATLKDDAGGDGLYTSSGVISEMKHRGASRDKDKISSHDHFNCGQMGLNNAEADGEFYDLLSQGGTSVSKKSGEAAFAHHAAATQHFKGGTMFMDQAQEAAHHTLTRHVGGHGDAEHSYDHFAAGSMNMASQSASLDLLSVGGASSQHLHKVEGHDRAKDHFAGQELSADAEGAGVDLLSADGNILSVHKHVEGAVRASDDHFHTGGMGLLDTAEAALRGVGKAGEHLAGQHSYDHFSAGGMMMGNTGSTDTGIFSAEGIAMGHEKHHEMGKHGVNKRYEDHFSLHGMGMSNEYNEGMGLTGASGAKMETIKHCHSNVGALEDHFSGGLYVAEGHGHLSQEDEKILNKNKHFVSFYT